MLFYYHTYWSMHFLFVSLSFCKPFPTKLKNMFFTFLLFNLAEHLHALAVATAEGGRKKDRDLSLTAQQEIYIKYNKIYVYSDSSNLAPLPNQNAKAMSNI